MSTTALSLNQRVSIRIGTTRSRLGWSGTVAIGFLVALTLIAVLAPLIAPYSPQQMDLASVFAEPSAQHLLGTDDLGRDIFSRLVWGARASLFGPFVVIGLALLLGTPLAIASAWCGGLVDVGIGRFFDIIFAFPGILLAVLTVALFGSGLLPCAVALSIAYMPWLARLTRSAALREGSKAYISAGRVQGFSGLSMCARHIAPNIAPIIIAQATVSFAYAFIDLAALSFLGFGVQPPAADWGLMVNSQSAILLGHPEQAIYAGTLIVLCVMAVTIIGQKLAEDPRQRG